MSITVHRVPAFSDNYLWLVEGESKQALVVDPGDASAIIEQLNRLELSLQAILITHHHPDHTGGIDALSQKYHCAVYGPDSKNIPQITHRVKEGDNVSVGGIAFQVLEVPGHTLDHIAYYSANMNNKPALFCGDTLFAGGCGRLFEGTPQQMLNSLSRLSRLPGETAVYCAHEYTQANLTFALAVEPHNSELVARCEQVGKLRSNGEATVPSSISLERATNPFLRSDEASVAEAAAIRLKRPPANSLETFTAIRAWKDNF